VDSGLDTGTHTVARSCALDAVPYETMPPGRGFLARLDVASIHTAPGGDRRTEVPRMFGGRSRRRGPVDRVEVLGKDADPDGRMLPA